MDETAGSLSPLLELAEQHRAAGLTDAQERRPPGRRRRRGARTRQERAAPSGRRRSTMPLIEIARAASKDEALAGSRTLEVRATRGLACYLEPPDVLVDAMRGRSTRVVPDPAQPRHVPANERPEQEALEVDYDPWQGVEM